MTRKTPYASGNDGEILHYGVTLRAVDTLADFPLVQGWIS
jgi:hypothetical protein